MRLEFQELYAVIGAWFFPLLALALPDFTDARIGRELRSRQVTEPGAGA